MTLTPPERGVSSAIAAYGEGYERGYTKRVGCDTPSYVLTTFEQLELRRGQGHGDYDRLLHRPQGTSFNPPTESDLNAYETLRRQEARNSHVRGDY